jgi:hypothetical protein
MIFTYLAAVLSDCGKMLRVKSALVFAHLIAEPV